MKSKIFGLGLSRTGTTTLNTILRECGYNMIHYPNDNELYSMNNDGATDTPVTAVYKELDKMFPNSKFIYTIRDKEEWMESIGPYLERKRNWNMDQRHIDIRNKIYGAPFFEEKKYSDAYDFWLKDITDYFKNRPNDLLILNIVNDIDKPQKLFDFLGIKAKAPEKFPHKNFLKNHSKIK